MNLRTRLAAALAAVLLASCGGGGDGDQSTSSKYDRLVSFGDSLSDVGTHKVGTVLALTAAQGGGRWSTSTPAGGDIWIKRVAGQLAVNKPCPAETGLLPNIPGITGAPVKAQAGCFNYAQGSARITSPLGPNSFALQTIPDLSSGGAPTRTLGLIAKPIRDQMAAHLAAAGGSYSGKELVTVVTGANDVLMELGLLGTPFGAATPQGAVANVALAGATLGALIKTEVLAKGAKRVLVLNIPDLAGTPFATSLAPDARGLIDAMVKAFNAQLTIALKDVPGVRLGDVYSVSKDQAANPGAYGLTNVTNVACGLWPQRLGRTGARLQWPQPDRRRHLTLPVCRRRASISLWPSAAGPVRYQRACPSRLAVSGRNTMNNTFALLALLASVVAGSAAHAQSAGTWSIRGSVTNISPDVTSGNLSAPSLPGTKTDVKSASQVSGGITYMYTDHFAVDLPLALPFRHDLVGAGAIAGVGKIGDVKVLPITVFGQYRFLEAQAQFRPYVGLGVTYANFFGERGSGILTGLTNPGGTPTRLSIDDRWGLTSQLGLVGRINERWFFDVSVAKTYLKTRNTLSTGQTLGLKLDPVSVSLGVGMRF